MRKSLLPVRDFKLAIAYTTAWISAFWLVEYPISDWAATAVVLYVSLWLAREVVSALVQFVAERMQEYAKRVAQKAGVELLDHSPPEYSLRDKLLYVALFLLLYFAIIGLSLTAGIPVLSLYGLAPLPSFFNWIAWGLFLVGGVGISLLFGIVMWLLSSADAGINTAIASQQAHAAVNRQPTELEFRLLFLYLLLLYHFHLQFGRRQP